MSTLSGIRVFLDSNTQDVVFAVGADSGPLSTTLYVLAKLLQSCATLCDPMGCTPPGSSVHGILGARILEGAAVHFSNHPVRSVLLSSPFCGGHEEGRSLSSNPTAGIRLGLEPTRV